MLSEARADLAAEVRRPTGDPIVDVVCDGSDGAAWVVLRRNWFRASAAVAPALTERLCHFYVAQHQVRVRVRVRARVRVRVRLTLTLTLTLTRTVTRIRS